MNNGVVNVVVVGVDAVFVGGADGVGGVALPVLSLIVMLLLVVCMLLRMFMVLLFRMRTVVVMRA